MQKQLIYDIPTRIFHWLFSGLFIFAFIITKTVDDETLLFSYHMLAGLMLVGLVALRLLWGFIGTSYARFSSFALKPTDLVRYLKGILSGDKKRWVGHNPASSWAALVMIACALLLGISGILMTSGYKETFEDAHELVANIFLITVLLHVAGVTLHALRHQDGIALAMVNGKKEVDEDKPKTVSQKPLIAVILIVVMALLGTSLVKNYDSTKNELSLFGKTLDFGKIKKNH